MRHPKHATLRPGAIGLAVALAVLAAPRPADAQIWKKVKETVKDAAETEAMGQVDRVVREQVQCLFDDPQCIREAEEDGQEVVLVDPEGTPIVDEEGAPVTDPDEAARIVGEGAGPPAEDDAGAANDAAYGAQAGAAGMARPGEGAWANYDFVPGEEVLFYEDYSKDNVGDFPRRFSLLSGNWDIVEWAGQLYLRATSDGHAAIPLPKTLPERFTIEVPVSLGHGNAYVRLTTGRAFRGRPRDYQGSAVSVEATRAGLRAVGTGPQVLAPLKHRFAEDGVTPLRIMADGDHMKVYLGEHRVTNAPNAVFPRSDTLFLAVSSAFLDRPILIGPIRIAGGGADLYDRLEAEGRVATHGILFATGSDAILPESTPTLEEIGSMLQEHPDLRLRIEGHTDSDGDEAYNQELSERRAASVKRFLTETYGVDEVRLETAGFGESQPAADNATPEGKQQNRRVELVRLEPGAG